MNEDIIRLIEYSIPLIIVVIGWLVTGAVNYRNYKKQKLIELKIKAYDDYKDAYISYTTTLGNVISNNLIISNMIKSEEGLKKINPDGEVITEEFIDDYVKLQENLNESIAKFYQRFSVYDLLYSKFSKEKILLYLEGMDIIKLAITPTFYLNILVSKKESITFKYKEEARKLLPNLLEEYSNSLGKLASASAEFNILLQNYLFGDIIKEKAKLVRLKSDNLTTLENLYEKHKDKIEQYDI